MQDWVRLLERTSKKITFQLKDESWLDVDVFEKINIDQSCISAELRNKNRGIIEYYIDGYISLSDVFQQYKFQKSDGYVFLIQLLDHLIHANRNKPVLLDTDYIFVNPFGNIIKFIVVPIHVEQWILQQETTQEFIHSLAEQYLTTTTFEIPGYLLLLSKNQECTLPNVLQGLKSLKNVNYPKKILSSLFHKNDTEFKVQEAFQPLYKEEVRQEMHKEVLTEKTQLIGTNNRQGAFLDLDGQRYDLISEIMLVGRSMQCDIRLKDDAVSLKHAKITYSQDRYYIQDLKSKNGTYLNEKKVIRKMRLREGMVVQFGLVKCIFHES